MIASTAMEINANINLTYSIAMGSIGFGRSINKHTPAIKIKLTYKNAFKRFDDLKNIYNYKLMTLLFNSYNFSSFVVATLSLVSLL